MPLRCIFIQLHLLQYTGLLFTDPGAPWPYRPVQRHVGKTNFSIWRHSVEQIYLGCNHNKSQRRVCIRCLSSKGGEDENRIFLFTPLHKLRNILRKLSYVYTSWSPVYLLIYYLCIWLAQKLEYNIQITYVDIYFYTYIYILKYN